MVVQNFLVLVGCCLSTEDFFTVPPVFSWWDNSLMNFLFFNPEAFYVKIYNK